MYEYTDNVLRYMRRRFIRLFHQFNSNTSFDELNVIQSSKALYEELEKITEEGLLLIAKRAYKDSTGKDANNKTINYSDAKEYANPYGESAKTVKDKEEDLKIVFTGDTKEFMLLAKGGACYINSIKVYFKE